MEPALFQVHYQTWGALRRDCDQQIGMRGLLLKTEASPEQFSPVVVRLRTPDEQDFDLPGEVIQVVPGQGVAVQFGAGSDSPIAQLRDLCQKRADDAQDTADPDPAVYPPGSSPPAAKGASQEASLPKKIEEMTVNEMRRAALHGRRDMRLLLIRDRNKTVHPFVLKNPSITLDEIEQIAKMPSVNPEVLRMIAANREWNRSTTVCRNLVRNPKTPMREALILLNKLPKSEIRALAKSGNVRTAIQQAARKKVTG